MRVCFDANVVIDLLGASSFADAALAAYDVANLRCMDAFVSSGCLADIAYILHRRGMPRPQVDRVMGALFEMFDVMDLAGEDCRRAYKNGMKDFEGAIIAECAAGNDVDLIVTRNIKDFRQSPVAAITPERFVATFRPDGYEYASASL